MKTYTFDVLPVDDNSGDVALQLTDDFCKDQDWRPGDLIEWIDLKDGSYQLVNKSKDQRK